MSVLMTKPQSRRKASLKKAETSRPRLQEAQITCSRVKAAWKKVEEMVQNQRAAIVKLNQKNAEAEKKLRAGREQLLVSHNEQLLALQAEYIKLYEIEEKTTDVLLQKTRSLRVKLQGKNAELELLKSERKMLQKDYQMKELNYKKQLEAANKKIAHLEETKSKLPPPHGQLCEKDALIAELEPLRRGNEKLEADYQIKEQNYKKQIDAASQEIANLREIIEASNKLQQAHGQTAFKEQLDEKDALIAKLESDYQIKLDAANKEISHLKKGHKKTDSKEDKSQMLAEIESLRAVLQLKQTEVSNFRRALAEANQKADLLPDATKKVSALTARCEDLQVQLERKAAGECQLAMDNKRLQDLLNEERNSSQRFLQSNEELQWKLKQNKDVLTNVLEQVKETPRTRASANDFDSDDSSPSSSKVMGVVERSDSISYVLGIEESPKVVASRIIRRSLRKSVPPNGASV